MMRFDDEQQMPGRRPNRDALLQQLGGGGQAQAGPATFGEWARQNPGPGMNFSPQGGSYVDQLLRREQDPAVQEWSRRAQEASRRLPSESGPQTVRGMDAGYQPGDGFAPGEPGGTMTRTGGAQATPRGPASINSVWDKMTSYAHTPQGLQQFFAENPDLVEGASIMGSKGDKIQFGDGKIYDVIQAAGEGGKSWQQLWDNDPNAAPDPVSRGGGMMGMSAGMPNFLQQDPSSAIQGQLAQFMQRSPNLAALIQQLQGGQGV